MGSGQTQRSVKPTPHGFVGSNPTSGTFFREKGMILKKKLKNLYQQGLSMMEISSSSSLLDGQV